VDLSDDRPVTIHSEGLKLNGLLHLPNATPCPGIVVAHPHPQYGGDMRNLVVGALCEAAVEAGFAALRFNFRGTGRSEGAFDNGTGEQRDLAGALEFLRQQPEIDGRAALAGYSFGAAVALRLAPPNVLGLIAVSPPTIGDWLSNVSINSPALFLAGDRDEYCDPNDLRTLAARLGEQAEVGILPGVDHFWVGSTDRLKDKTGSFLRKHLA